MDQQPLRRARHIPPKITRAGNVSQFQTVRIYGKQANPESLYLYISTNSQLSSARRLWVVGYGTPTGQSEGAQSPRTPDGKAYLTVMPARRGDYYKGPYALQELREWLPKFFSEVDYVDINWRTQG